MSATRTHHGKKTPECKSRKAEPEGNPVEGEEAEEAEGSGGDKAANLGGIDRVEIEILDLGSDKRAFAQGLV